MTSCPIEPTVFTADIPHPMVGDMQCEKLTIDLDGCNVFVITVGMNEYDRKQTLGMRFDGWPAAVQAIFSREIDGWVARNPRAALRAITQSVADGVFTVALHWRPRS